MQFRRPRLSPWALRAVATSLAQSYDFIQNPPEHNLGRGQRLDAATLGLILATERAFPRRKCAWKACGKREAYHGQTAVCSRCREVAYCCKEHQAMAWRQGHRKTCVKVEDDDEDEDGEDDDDGDASAG